MLKASFLPFLLARLGLEDSVISGFQITESLKDSMTVYLPLNWSVLEAAFRNNQPLSYDVSYDFQKIDLPYRYFDGTSWIGVNLEFTPFKSGSNVQLTTESVEVKTPAGLLLEAPSFAIKEIFLG